MLCKSAKDMLQSFWSSQKIYLIIKRQKFHCFHICNFIVCNANLGQGKAILLQESIILGKILNISVIPSKKVCVSCRIKMHEMLKDSEQPQKDETVDLEFVSPNLELRRIEEKVDRENLLAKFNATIGLFDLTPASALPRYVTQFSKYGNKYYNDNYELFEFLLSIMN